MPTVPVNAAGWRIEPPVSVAVAPKQRSAATAEAEPPDDPPGVSLASSLPRRHGLTTGAEARGLVRRAHRELIHVELAQHQRAIAPEIGGDRAFVSRREFAEDVGARRRAHAFGAEQILDPERRAFERAGLAPARGVRRRLWRAARAASGVVTT